MYIMDEIHDISHMLWQIKRNLGDRLLAGIGTVIAMHMLYLIEIEVGDELALICSKLE